MKIVFLSRYQSVVNRGAESFVEELSTKLKGVFEVDVFNDKNADSLSKILQGKYDVVIPVNGRKQSFLASIGRAFYPYKLVITGQSGRGVDDIWNMVVVRPDAFVALTNTNTVWAKKWAWGTTVVKIPNGVDIDKFSPGGPKIEINLRKPIILSVGALVWYKHHELAIKAVARLRNGSLLVVGEGKERELLERLGKQLLGDRFKIMDFPFREMPMVYRACDLFTLPSWDREAFGISYLEALASGLGVVAPDDASRREIIGEGGLYTDVYNIEEYCKTIQEALSINWLKKARKQSEQFSWDKVAREYQKLILSLKR